MLRSLTCHLAWRWTYRRYKRWQGHVPAEHFVDFVGQMSERKFEIGSRPDPLPARFERASYPPPGESLKWTAVLDAIDAARNRFVMLDGGAGYGRWLVGAAFAIRQRSLPLDTLLIGIEAEPTHFTWLRSHFIDSGLDPDHHRLIHGAIGAADGEASFMSGKPGETYGQLVVTPDHLQDGFTTIRVPCFSLSTILYDIDRVDLVIFDVQGAEAYTIIQAADTMNRKVARINVNTHSEEIELELRAFFKDQGWRCVQDYTLRKKNRTPYGEIPFTDGMQDWVNPQIG